ncbi:hypothetical protein BLTE_24770 [Blastochloris tepida]|uniref:Glycosyl transferase n=2 Tax=Blastochloris tepida TaxID=2233851 RepID=A0A348G2K9_9HYPH|nr:hypothetical protein BLTE_24770 [Blastochloris tepida]
MLLASPGGSFADQVFQEYRSSVGDICDVIKVVHVKDEESPPFNERDGILTLNNKQIFAEVVHSKDISRGLIPGNVDLKMIRAVSGLNKSYSRYIWMEYDVMATGDVRQSMERLICATKDCDFAGSYISPWRNNNWVWWKTLELPKDLSVSPDSVAYGAFLPLIVFSRRYIDAYAEQIALGWKGHQEVTMPSVANFVGLRMLDLSKTTPPFTHYPQFNVHKVDRLRECVPLFVHPVKDLTAKAAIAADLTSVSISQK